MSSICNSIEQYARFVQEALVARRHAGKRLGVRRRQCSQLPARAASNENASIPCWTLTTRFSIKVGLEAVRGVKTVREIAQEFGVHPVLVGQSKKDILENAGALFDAKRRPKPIDQSSPKDKLYG